MQFIGKINEWILSIIHKVFLSGQNFFFTSFSANDILELVQHMSKYMDDYKLTVIYTRIYFVTPTQELVTYEEQKITGKESTDHNISYIENYNVQNINSQVLVFKC